MRIYLTLLLTLMAGSLAHAGVSLTAKRIDPTTVELDWTSGTPSYGVYRPTLPSGVASPGNFLSLTGATSYVDGSAAASSTILCTTRPPPCWPRPRTGTPSAESPSRPTDILGGMPAL